MLEVANPGLQDRIKAIVPTLNRLNSPLVLAAAAFALTVIVLLLYKPFAITETGDPSIYDYIAQSILRGDVPYKDVVDIKGPLSPHLSALAMAAGKLVGLRDVLAVRLFQILLTGLLSAVIFLVAEAYLRSRITGLIAFLIPLSSSKFIGWMLAGTQPKLPMILFGMASLLLIARDGPFWAGVLSMLSCLCWQPGLMFTGVAFLIFSRYLTSWRDLRAMKVVAGAVVPLAIVIVYFHWRGALADMWAWTIEYNYSVFGSAAQRPFGAAMLHLSRVAQRTYGADIVLVWFGVAGLLVYGVERLRAKLKGKGSWQDDLFRDAIVLPPVIYFAFTLINLQAGPDLIPFIPFIGIFAAWIIIAPRRLVSSGNSDDRPRRISDIWLPTLALVLMLSLAFFRATSPKREEDYMLQAQDRQFAMISDLLEPHDKIYAHGAVDILVLLNRPNLNPYVFLDWKADLFAAARRSMDFSEIIDEMESQRPRIVALSRLNNVSSADLFLQWINDHYTILLSSGDDMIYIRK